MYTYMYKHTCVHVCFDHGPTIVMHKYTGIYKELEETGDLGFNVMKL